MISMFHFVVVLAFVLVFCLIVGYNWGASDSRRKFFGRALPLSKFARPGQVIEITGVISSINNFLVVVRDTKDKHISRVINVSGVELPAEMRSGTCTSGQCRYVIRTVNGGVYGDSQKESLEIEPSSTSRVMLKSSADPLDDVVGAAFR